MICKSNHSSWDRTHRFNLSQISSVSNYQLVSLTRIHSHRRLFKTSKVLLTFMPQESIMTTTTVSNKKTQDCPSHSIYHPLTWKATRILTKGMKEIRLVSILSLLRWKALKIKWALSPWRTPWKQAPLTSQSFSLNQCQSSSKVNQCMGFLSHLLSNSCRLLRLSLEVPISSSNNSSKPLWWEDFNSNNNNSNSIRLSHCSQSIQTQLSMEEVLKVRVRNLAKVFRINCSLLDQKQLSHLSNNHPSCLSQPNKSLLLKTQCSMAINRSHPNSRLLGLMEVRHNQLD
jgi:hypothetical protein